MNKQSNFFPKEGEPIGNSKLVDDGEFFERAIAILSLPRPAIGIDVVNQVLKKSYGLVARVTILASELESTALVEAPGGESYVLKFSSRPEARASFAYQCAALTTLESKCPGIGPRIIHTVSGATFFEGFDGPEACTEGVFGYMQTALVGTLLKDLTLDGEMRHELGAMLANVDLALAGVRHPSSLRPVLWNLRCWPKLRQFSPLIDDKVMQVIVENVMDSYERNTVPKLSSIPWQATQADPSPFNLMRLGGGEGFGIIDFGDGTWSPRAVDLATAAGHHLSDPNLPLGGAEDVFAGYTAYLRLSPLEIECIGDLMAMRMAVLLLISAWRDQQYPEEAVYTNKNMKKTRLGLAFLDGFESDRLYDLIGSACMGDNPCRNQQKMK